MALRVWGSSRAAGGVATTRAGAESRSKTPDAAHEPDGDDPAARPRLRDAQGGAVLPDDGRAVAGLAWPQPAGQLPSEHTTVVGLRRLRRPRPSPRGLRWPRAAPWRRRSASPPTSRWSAAPWPTGRVDPDLDAVHSGPGQLERGARWVRCDVLARSGDQLVALPDRQPLLRQGVPEQLRDLPEPGGRRHLVRGAARLPGGGRLPGGRQRLSRPGPLHAGRPQPVQGADRVPSAASGSRPAGPGGRPATGSSAACRPRSARRMPTARSSRARRCRGRRTGRSRRASRWRPPPRR